jgi:radical SAM superfamily enzyme YgiQ (UPF0313 family)
MFSRRSADAMEPLVFAIIAGVTPPDVELTMFDDRVEEIDFNDNPDLVALTVQTFTARRAYNIAARYREKGIPVVMGGFHPTLLPDETLLHADAIAMGDAESTWPQIVRDARQKKLKRLYKSDPDYPLEGIKPDSRIFRGKKYTKMTPVQFGRGCRFSCDFCSVHSFYGNTLRNRPVEDVIAEIEKRNKKFIFFVDDNLFSNYDQVTRLIRGLIPLNIKWVCQISLDTAYDGQLLELLEKSGCAAVFVGLESLDEENLKQMKKGENLQHRDYADAVRRFKDHGIMVCGAFVFGYDHDTADTIERALEFSIESRLCIAHFNPLFPSPKTPLYDRLKKEKRLISDPWWLSTEFRYGQGFFHPRLMTVDELADKCFEARCKFNTYGCIARRALDRKANSRSLFHLSSFLAANLISRKEIYLRQGSELG